MIIDAIINLPLWQRVAMALVITPFSIVAVKVIFESTILRFKSQSLSLVPGDFFLAIAFICGTEGYVKLETWQQAHWAAWPILAVCVGVFFLFRRSDKKNYRDDRQQGGKSALHSPSKLYHDVITYIVYAWLMGSSGLPVLFFGSGQARFGVLLGLGLWVLMCALDRPRGTVKSASAEITTWVPIWAPKPPEWNNKTIRII